MSASRYGNQGTARYRSSWIPVCTLQQQSCRVRIVYKIMWGKRAGKARALRWAPVTGQCGRWQACSCQAGVSWSGVSCVARRPVRRGTRVNRHVTLGQHMDSRRGAVVARCLRGTPCEARRGHTERGSVGVERASGGGRTRAAAARVYGACGHARSGKERKGGDGTGVAAAGGVWPQSPLAWRGAAPRMKHKTSRLTRSWALGRRRAARRGATWGGERRAARCRRRKVSRRSPRRAPRRTSRRGGTQSRRAAARGRRAPRGLRRGEVAMVVVEEEAAGR